MGRPTAEQHRERLWRALNNGPSRVKARMLREEARQLLDAQVDQAINRGQGKELALLIDLDLLRFHH